MKENKGEEGESLLDIKRNIVKEGFKVHESNIKKIISSNVNKTNEYLDKLSSEVVDLTASLEFTQKRWRETSPGKKKKEIKA